MAKSIKLSVKALKQDKKMSCWHTSAQMVYGFWQSQPGGRAGPMNTMSPEYDNADSDGLSPQLFVTLGQTAGLFALPTKGTFTADNLKTLIADFGPMWAAGYWYGDAHVIVITGADSAKVYLNDPDGGKKKSGSIAWFNEKLANFIDGSLMVKDPGSN